MADKELKGKRRIGSVKAAISKYGGKVHIETNLRNKHQNDAQHSKGPGSKAQELHIAQKTVNKIKENRRTAETVTNEAELELLKAKKTVRELTSQIDDLKLKASHRTDVSQTLNVVENNQYKEVQQELENLKREFSKIKLDMGRVLEEKSRAEKEANAAGLRHGFHLKTVEKLRREIEEANEEEVLVELAQIQALKELAEIKAQRKQEEQKYSSKIQEARKKVSVLRKEAEQVKKLEEVLAITNSEADVLQNELNLIKEMDERIARKQEASIKSQVFQVMASMDSTRIELNNVLKEKDEIEKMEAKTEKYIQKLNSKLLRLKDKLEVASASEEKAKSMLPSFIVSLEELKKVKEEVEKEKDSIIKETEDIRADIKRTKSMTDLSEDRLQATIQEIEAVKAAEAKALMKLETLVESTVVARASRETGIITISKFEYDYLTGSAMGAVEVADKKIAAANAWVDALRANAEEMELKVVTVKREIKELKMKEQQELKNIKIPLDEEKGIVQGRRSMVDNSYNLTSVRPAKFRKSVGSPAVRRPIISTALTLKRKKKVIHKIANYFAIKETENEKMLSPEEI